MLDAVYGLSDFNGPSLTPIYNSVADLVGDLYHSDQQRHLTSFNQAGSEVHKEQHKNGPRQQ